MTDGLTATERKIKENFNRHFNVEKKTVAILVFHNFSDLRVSTPVAGNYEKPKLPKFHESFNFL